MMHIKDLEKENRKSQGHVIPVLTPAVCLPLRSTWVSQPPAPPDNIFTWKKLREDFNFRRAFIKIDQDPTLTISFNLNSFCKDPMSKYSHTVVVEGASGLQHMNGEGRCNSVRSRGVIFKISNYCPQAPINQNRRLPSLVRC